MSVVLISGVEVLEGHSGEKERNCTVQCWCAALLLPLLHPLQEGACQEGGHGQLIARARARLVPARSRCHLCHLSTALPAAAGSSLCQDLCVFSLEDGAVPAVLPARGQWGCEQALCNWAPSPVKP